LHHRGQTTYLVFYLFWQATRKPVSRQAKTNDLEVPQRIIVKLMPGFPKWLIVRIRVEERGKLVNVIWNHSVKQDMSKHMQGAVAKTVSGVQGWKADAVHPPFDAPTPKLIQASWAKACFCLSPELEVQLHGDGHLRVEGVSSPFPSSFSNHGS
jgi:hypothetical protein